MNRIVKIKSVTPDEYELKLSELIASTLQKQFLWKQNYYWYNKTERLVKCVGVPPAVVSLIYFPDHTFHCCQHYSR